MRREFRFIGTLGLLLVFSGASAQRVEGQRAVAQGLYESEVSVNSQTDAERNNGFARALIQVLAKVSGERNAAAKPGMREVLRNAREFVAGYDFRQDQTTSAGGAPSYSTTLVVRFDPAKVDQVAAGIGLPLWPQPRPKPVLWLAIDDGSGPRLVGLKQISAAQPLTTRAIERGYRLGLPAGSAAEQAAIGAIWRGDAAAISRLSLRYSPPIQLIGKLYRNQGGWTADWTFVDNGNVQSQWSVSNSDARRALASGADGAADALTRKYARQRAATGLPAHLAPPAVPAAGTTYRVSFAGLDSSDDYLRLSGYLQTLPLVRKITPIRSTAAQVDFDLELVVPMVDFKQRLEVDGIAAGGESEPVVFRMP